jgi:hypothetical protein
MSIKKAAVAVAAAAFFCILFILLKHPIYSILPSSARKNAYCQALSFR